MGSKGSIGEKMLERFRGPQKGPPISAKDRKAAFYGIFGAAALLVILALFTVAYVGTPVPLDLIRLDNFSFSFAGSPTYTYIFSDGFYTGLKGIGGTTTTLEVGEGSRLNLFPSGKINVTYRNGTTATVDEKQYPFTLPAGERAEITITVRDEDNANYNMNFKYRNQDPVQGATIQSLDMILREFDRNQSQLQIIKESQDRYYILSNYTPGAWKTFEIKRDQTRHFPVLINITHADECRYCIGTDDIGHIEYEGSINVFTGNTMRIRSSVSKLSEIASFAIMLKNAKGVLDVQHLDHDSNGADKIAILKGDRDINVSLRCGEVVATGSAKELSFRDKEFQRPLWVIIKEGNFALLTTLLSSFMTIMFAKAIATMKKKS